MNVAALLLNKNSMFVEDFQVNEEGKGNSSSFAHILQKKLPNVSKELQDFLLHSNLLAAEDMNELLVSLNNTEHEEQLIKDLLQNVLDRKSTRLNSSHVAISYAVFCLKKKKITIHHKAA